MESDEHVPDEQAELQRDARQEQEKRYSEEEKQQKDKQMKHTADAIMQESKVKTVRQQMMGTIKDISDPSTINQRYKTKASAAFKEGFSKAKAKESSSGEFEKA